MDTLGAKYFNQRRRQKGCDHRQAFARSEPIKGRADLCKGFFAASQDRPDIQRLELSGRTHSSHRFSLRLVRPTNMLDQKTEIALNQSAPCAIHQLASGVLFAASAGICSSAKSAWIRKASSGFNIRKETQRSGNF